MLCSHEVSIFKHPCRTFLWPQRRPHCKSCSPQTFRRVLTWTRPSFWRSVFNPAAMLCSYARPTKTPKPNLPLSSCMWTCPPVLLERHAICRSPVLKRSTEGSGLYGAGVFPAVMKSHSQLTQVSWLKRKPFLLSPFQSLPCPNDPYCCGCAMRDMIHIPPWPAFPIRLDVLIQQGWPTGVLEQGRLCWLPSRWYPAKAAGWVAKTVGYATFSLNGNGLLAPQHLARAPVLGRLQ